MGHEDRLGRVFDQVRLPPERREALLAELLTQEGSARRRRPRLPRLAAAVLVAALLVSCTCAAVGLGLDRRLLDYFGVGPEQEPLLAAAAVPVDVTSRSAGAVLHVRQVLADRYAVAVLIDFTAPEGTALDGWSDLWLEDTVRATAPDGTELSAWSAGCTQLAAPADGTVTLLYSLWTWDEGFDFLGARLSLAFDGLMGWGPDGQTRERLVSGHWTCTLTLPDEDPGRWCALDRPLTLNGEETVLHAVYVSPLTFGFDLREGGGDWPTAAQAFDAVTGGDATDGDTIGLALRTADGRTVAAGERILLSTRYRTDLRAEGTGRYLFRLTELVDPDAVVSCTLFGQSFSLGD